MKLLTSGLIPRIQGTTIQTLLFPLDRLLWKFHFSAGETVTSTEVATVELLAAANDLTTAAEPLPAFDRGDGRRERTSPFHPRNLST